jgi:hypothetical protein
VEKGGSKNSLSPSGGGSRGGRRYRKQIVKAMTHIQATGTCVREYGCVSGLRGCIIGVESNISVV